MRRLLLALLLCWPLAGADHYVNSTCTNAGDGTAAGCAASPGGVGAWKTIASVNAHTLAGDDFVYFARGGSWAEQLTPGQSGSDGHPITYTAYGTGALPKITGGTNAVLQASSKTDIVYSLLDFGKQVVVDSGSEATFVNCYVRNSASMGFSFGGNGTVVNIYRSLIANNSAEAIRIAAASVTVTARNNLFIGNGYGTTSSWNAVTVNAGATFDYDYNLFAGNTRSPGAQVNGSGTKTDGGHNIVDAVPMMKSPSNGNAYFNFGLDGDYQNATYWADVAAALPAGAKFTLFAVTANTSAAQQTEMQSLVAAGHEVASHTWGHSPLTAASGFSVTTTNTGTNTFTVDTVGKTVSLTSTGNPENNVSVSFTTDTGPSDTGTVCDLKHALNPAYSCVVMGTSTAATGKGWSITNTAVSPIYISDYMRLKALASASTTTFPATAALDSTAFLNEEIADSVTWIAGVTGVTPTTVAYPAGLSNATVKAYMTANGLAAGRAIATGYGTLSSIDMQQIASVQSSSANGAGTEAAIRAAARHYYTLHKEIGGVFTLYFHSAADMSTSQIAWWYDELIALGATPNTLAAIAAAIRADHSCDGNDVCTKAYTNVLDARMNKCPSNTTRYMGCYLGEAATCTAYPLGLSPHSNTDVQTLNSTAFGCDIGPFTWIKRKAVGQ